MHSFIELVKYQFSILMAVDPCKKCIVKVCCTEECYSRKKYLKTTGGESFLMKFCSLMIILSSIILILHLFDLMKKLLF
jgi:hypothetical protein